MRGVILSDGAVHKVEVGGREAILRAATAADITGLLERAGVPECISLTGGKPKTPCICG